MSGNNLGRDKLPWKPDRWDLIDRVVHDEAARTRVGRKAVPCVPLADAPTAPADTIGRQDGLLQVNQTEVTPIIELWVEFALTEQQIVAEDELSTAVTLATRAANLLSQGEDLLIFQGCRAFETSSLFTEEYIHHRPGPGPEGLANEDIVDKEQVVEVRFSEPEDERYGEESFTQVANAYSKLQTRGHYGPYALALPTRPYADSFAPLKTTFMTPQSRISALVDQHYYGTGTLPEYTGVMLSLGGNTLDLVVCQDAVTAFVQGDKEGLYHFRVFERFALRDEDRTGRILLKYQEPERHAD